MQIYIYGLSSGSWASGDGVYCAIWGILIFQRLSRSGFGSLWASRMINRGLAGGLRLKKEKAVSRLRKLVLRGRGLLAYLGRVMEAQRCDFVWCGLRVRSVDDYYMAWTKSDPVGF